MSATITLDDRSLLELEEILLDHDSGAALDFLQRLFDRMDLEARRKMRTPLEHPGDRL